MEVSKVYVYLFKLQTETASEKKERYERPKFNISKIQEETYFSKKNTENNQIQTNKQKNLACSLRTV